MKETQTPRKDILYRRPKDSPSSKSIFEQSKKNQKVSRKNLNSEFASVSEDSLLESVAETVNLSQVSEVTIENSRIRESFDSFESLIVAENQSIGTSEEVSTESTPCSKIATVSCDELVNQSLDCSKTFESNNSVEVDVVVNLLKQARNQVVSSTDVPAASKKLLDALVESSVRNICALPEEEDRIDWLLSNKLRVVMVCSAVWLIPAILFVNRCSGTQNFSSFYPPPT